MTRFFAGLLVLLTGRLVHAEGMDANTQVSRNSAFIQRLLQQPISANPQDRRVTALILYRTDNGKDGEALDQFEKRRLLARFLGEPFEFSGTVGQAIEAERGAEPLKNVIARALGSVTVDYASPDTTTPPPTPESTLLGNGIWATGPGNARIQMPMVIRHSLHVPATSVGIEIGSTQSGRSQPYYLFLTCKPANAAAFVPGAPQLALCAGGEGREGTNLAIEALLKRQIPFPLPVYSFMTREADLMGNFLRFNDEGKSALDAAAQIVASASCEDLGNCEAVAKVRSAARWQAARPGVLWALAIAVFLLAGFASSRVPPRESTGWFVNSLSVLVVAVSSLAIAVMFQVTAPNLGLEGIAYYAFLIYGLPLHLISVGVIAMAVAGGNATRLRAFALTLGLVTPVVVWLCILAFGR